MAPRVSVESAPDPSERTTNTTADPFSPNFAGPFNSVVVKVTDLCPVAGNAEWCG